MLAESSNIGYVATSHGAVLNSCLRPAPLTLVGIKCAPDRSQKLPLLRQLESFPFPVQDVVGKSASRVSLAIGQMPRLHAASLQATLSADPEGRIARTAMTDHRTQ